MEQVISHIPEFHDADVDVTFADNRFQVSVWDPASAVRVTIDIGVNNANKSEIRSAINRLRGKTEAVQAPEGWIAALKHEMLRPFRVVVAESKPPSENKSTMAKRMRILRQENGED